MSTTVQAEATKMRLATSLKKLMAIKPLNKISIRELVEDCGVNRQTFYYHFQDIYDLLKWLFEQEAILLLRAHHDFVSWEEGLRQLFDYLQDNKAICLCALHSLGNEDLRRLFYVDARSIVRRVIDDVSEDLIVADEYKEFLAHFYAVAFVGLGVSWLLSMNGREDSPEKLIQNISITMRGNIRGALERYAED